MINLLFNSPLAFIVIFPGLLISIVCHEFAHAFIADRLGDPTPRSQGRLSLHPKRHLDPLGTIMILLTHFGWGKPVIFDPYNLKEPKRDAAFIALAGPTTNLLLALFLSLMINFLPINIIWLQAGLAQVLIINVVLAIFNLIPVYPLDGSKIAIALLPKDISYEYEKFMNRYGMFVLLALIIPWNGVSPVSSLIWPVISLIANILL